MNRTHRLVYMALLVATSIVFTRVFGVMLPIAGVGALRLSFGEIPIILAGLLMGPVAGGVVGTLADLLGYALNPMGGPYFPGFTLTAALTGILPALFLRWFFNNRLSLASILVAIACSELLTSVILNTFWLSIMYGRAFFVLLPLRFAARVILVPTYALVISVATRHFYVLAGQTRRA